MASLTCLAVSAAHWLGRFGSHLVYHFPEDKTGLLHGMVASGAKWARMDISSTVLRRPTFQTCSSSLLPHSIGQINSRGQHRFQGVERLDSTSCCSQYGDVTLQRVISTGRCDSLGILIITL